MDCEDVSDLLRKAYEMFHIYDHTKALVSGCTFTTEDGSRIDGMTWMQELLRKHRGTRRLLLKLQVSQPTQGILYLMRLMKIQFNIYY